MLGLIRKHDLLSILCIVSNLCLTRVERQLLGTYGDTNFCSNHLVTALKISHVKIKKAYHILNGTLPPLFLTTASYFAERLPGTSGSRLLMMQPSAEKSSVEGPQVELSMYDVIQIYYAFYQGMGQTTHLLYLFFFFFFYLL